MTTTGMRSLRLTVPDDLFRQIERTARICNLSVAKAAALHMAAGCVVLDVMADDDLRKVTP